MTYPNVTLKIENHKPVVIYRADKGTNREMIRSEVDLDELITELAELLDLETESYEEILTLCEHGVERLMEDLPTLNKYSTDFELEKLTKDQAEKLKENMEDYSNYEDVSKEVLEELSRNQSVDILSSIVEMIYNILIAKTVMTSSDLAIGNIVLEDMNNYLRLHSKMASELAKMDTKLEIVKSN